MTESSGKSLRLGVSLVLLLTVVGNVNAYTELGPLEIRITDHKPGIDQFHSLNVTLDKITLHRKGFGRSDGWIHFTSEAMDFSAIDIVPLKDGRYRSLGEGQLPVGSYDAVRIIFSSAVGRLKTDSEPLVRANGTTIATAITVYPGSNSPILIDLYAEDQTEHELPQYVVKVKEIRIVKENRSANPLAE